MLYLKKGTVSKLHLTLGDMQTLAGGHFLFVFKHRGTGETKAWVENASGDVSLYPARYNAFNVNVDQRLGADAAPGTWTFQVYEQPSLVNLDPELATGLLETGIAALEPAAAPVTVKYSGAARDYKYYTQ